MDAGVQAGNALAGNDLLDGITELAGFLLGFDLGTCGEGDERVAEFCLLLASVFQSSVRN